MRKTNREWRPERIPDLPGQGMLFECDHGLLEPLSALGRAEAAAGPDQRGGHAARGRVET